jgi:hypothetical protein
LKKNGLIAFLLAFIPGVGHAYLNRKARAVLYGIGFFGVLGAGLLLAVATNMGQFFFLGVLAAFVLYAVNLLDMIITLLTRLPSAHGHAQQGPGSFDAEERSTVLLLSLIPGLGHLQMGLMNRGLTLLGSFFGLITMVVFLVLVTKNPVFLALLCLLTVIWLFGLFDAVRLLDQKSRGEALADKSIFEELEAFREEGRKSGMVATLLAVFPGAGHMYLGQQRRGLQLMAAFLGSLYLLDTLRISLFLFLIPLLWFFSFFDALQQISKYRRQVLDDVPVVNVLAHHQKWVGITLLALGLFYLFDRVALPVLEQWYPDLHLTYWFEHHFQITVVALLLLGGGIRLLIGSRQKKGEPS